MTKLLALICSILFFLTSFVYVGYASSNNSNPELDRSGLNIDLIAASFDPQEGSPDIPRSLMYFNDVKYYLVQCSGPIQSRWSEDILGTGAVILGYVPQYTYLLYMEDAAKSSIDEFPFVRWVGAYHPAYKLDHELFSKQGTVQLNVMVFEPGGGNDNYEIVKDKLVSLGGSIIREEPEADNIVAEIDPALIDDIAFTPEVEWIDEYSEPRALMDNIRVFTGAESPLHEFGFNGSGIVGEVKDNGIDQDHLEFEGRLIATDGNVDESTHGTSTFGIVFARGAEARAQGMIPGAKGIFASWGVGRKASIANLVNNWGGIFQSNSWSSGSNDGTYGSNTRQNDESVFEYDISMLYATANGGADESISQEATAKNVISVGATNHYNNQDRTDDRHTGNQGNKGPTADGRIKPDLVGPYDSIYTTTTNDRYTSGFGGTSGATPIVAGAAGLVYEMYRENHFNNNPGGKQPHAATIKAIMIADAYQYEFAQADRYAQGWGLVDVGNSYNIGKNHLIDQDSNALQTGGSRTYKIVPTTATPMKISLVWTDVPGTTSASMHLINDLDLKVTAPDGRIYYGNNGLEDTKWSTTGGEFDRLNNVENVFIAIPESGEWTIEVFGGNVPMDGDLTTPKVDQSYALVASGVTKHDHDLKLQSLEFPKLVGTGEEVQINATVLNIGTFDEDNVMVQLQVDNTTVSTTTINSIGVGNVVETRFTWIPLEEKQYYISVYVEPQSGETSTWDNRFDGIISANIIDGMVLVDDGHGTDPSHDLYYLYLETIGMEMYRVHHTTQPISSFLLEKYDAFISAGPTIAYSQIELDAIENFVNTGGGLLVIGEADTGIYNDLTNYAGIQWGNQYFVPYSGETTEINPHEITENINSLYFNSPQVPLTATAPSEELVYTYGGVLYNRVTVAAGEHGQGRVVAVADTDCLDSQYINLADNRVFGLNIVQWLTNARPNSVINSPLWNSTYLVSDTIQFDGSSSYDSEDESLDFQWRSSIQGIIGTQSVFNTSLTYGQHTITLQVTDSGGKIGEADIPVLVRSPPSVSISTPGNGALLNSVVELSGAASDPDGIVRRVEVRLDDGSWKRATDASPQKDLSTWTFSLDTTGTSDGGHELSARSMDNDNLNSSIISITINFDNTAPTIITGPEVESISDTGATIEWETDEPGSSIVEYGPDRNYGSSESGVSLLSEHIIVLSDLWPKTVYHFRVISVDAAGNDPAISIDMMFETLRPPDFTPPTVLITSPSDNATLVGEVSITADISDNQGISEVKIFINDELEFSDSDSNIFWPWDTTRHAYPDGRYTVRVSATDLAGNTASDVVTVILDNEVIPPNIDRTSVTPGTIKSGAITEVLFIVQLTDIELRTEFVEIDLVPISGSEHQHLYDDGTHGDLVAGDSIYTFETLVSSDLAGGERTLEITVVYGDGEIVMGAITVDVIAQSQDGGFAQVPGVEPGQELFWLFIITIVIVIVGIIAYFAMSGRDRSDDGIEVELIDDRRV